MSKYVYLMRHAQTLFNERHKIQGWCDSPITKLGYQQIEAAKEYVDTLDLDHLYSSTSERACETLELVSGNRPYTRLKELKERYFGTFEGESEDFTPKWPNGYDDLFTHFGGESDQDVISRMVTTITTLMNKEDHKNILIVSHAGAMFSFLSSFMNMEDLKKYPKITNCSILKIRYEEGKYYLEDVITKEVEGA